MAESKGRRGGQLYELRGPMREIRLARGWSQGGLAKASRTYAQVISQIELGTTRITEAKALRICEVLGADLAEMFLCVLPTNTAAATVGVAAHTLLRAAHDPRSPITPYAVETKGAYRRCYFIEDDLRRQIAELPRCAAESCGETSWVGDVCGRHAGRTMPQRPRRDAMRPASERRWLTKTEAASAAGRAAETIERAAEAGELRMWRVGKFFVIPKSDLFEWAANVPDWDAITKEMHRLYETGLTCAQVGAQMGYGRDLVVRRLNKAGYKLRRGPRGCSPATAEVLRRAREVARSGQRTSLELAGRALLESLGVDFIEQHPLGVYTVDFFIPKIGLVVEADGSYWHQSEAKERARDAYLLREPGVRDILHLNEEQLKPWVPTTRDSTEYRTAIRAA